MLHSYEESTTGSNDLDGGDGSGLVLTGIGNDDGGNRYVIRAYGIYAASALTSYALRLKSGSTIMRTIDGGSSVITDSAVGQAIVVPPGWTVEFSTSGASAGCTAWCQYEKTQHV
jgi:hypothetical protein